MFTRKSNPSGLEVLEKYEHMLAEACRSRCHRIGDISKGLAGKWENKILDEAYFIITVSKGREALRKTIRDLSKGKEQSSETKARLRFQISSLFLRDCWEYLRSDPSQNERLSLITGTIAGDGTRVLSRMEQVKYDRQSPAFVSVDQMDSQRKMIALEEAYGHFILAAFHSHMSHGIATTAPSSIDRAFMSRMSQIGCHCLGGIFSLDGYVRFFTASGDFEVEVYGSGIDEVEENSAYRIFKISEADDRGRKGI